MQLTYNASEVAGLALRYAQNNLHLEDQFNKAEMNADGSVTLSWDDKAVPAKPAKRSWWPQKKAATASDDPVQFQGVPA